MTNLKLFVLLIFIIACSSTEQEDIKLLKARLTQLEADQEFITKKKKDMQQYLKDVMNPDWKVVLQKYMPASHPFFESHAKFRETHHNLSFKIKYYVGSPDQGMMWLEVKSRHGGSGEGERDVLRDISPSGTPITWEEVWYFGDPKDNGGWNTWDLLVRDLDKMKSAKIECLPADFFKEANQ